MNKLSIRFGDIYIVQNGKLFTNYNESEVSSYMEGDNIDINVSISNGSKKFTAYTMDLTKKYLEINSDYRSWMLQFILPVNRYKSWLNID